MFASERVRADLAALASKQWLASVLELCDEVLFKAPHGDMPVWQAALSALPAVDPAELTIHDGAVAAAVTMNSAEILAAREQLLALSPWRKGPFNIGGLFIDAEWRSDLKWQRIASAVRSFHGRNVLDVGCGNGYYAMHMRQQGAKLVLGVDPTILFSAQFAAIAHFLKPQPVHVLPLRLEQLPSGTPQFDTTLSMGVLYHQRSPWDHLKQLHDTLTDDGELILETLIIPGSGAEHIVPESRYARMRNVWHLPTRGRLIDWLGEAGFIDLRVVDETATTIDEQRPTEWMPFESLAHALDPDNSGRTVEGLPAPLRIVITGRRTKGGQT